MNIEHKLDNITSIPFHEFKEVLEYFFSSTIPPEINVFKKLTKNINHTLNNEKVKIRPRGIEGLPGGLIYLKDFKKVIILPDLHARRDFLKALLYWKPKNISIFELLDNKKLAILCLGDGIHSESQKYQRWINAYEEFLNGYDDHENIDNEISDSFNLMLCIFLLKIRYKDNFHFLKGNHENILNETKNGNYSFSKFCNEGAMILKYFNTFYDKELLISYSEFERSLPLFAVGNNFLASHSEPRYNFTKKRIINYNNDSELIEALTWTENNESQKGTIDSLIKKFIKDEEFSVYYFGGHRIIDSKYKIVNNTKFIQIHNSKEKIVVYIENFKKIDLENNIHIL